MSSLHRVIVNPVNLIAITFSLTSTLLMPASFVEEPRSTESVPAQQQARPLDPLTPEEIETATRIADADQRVKLELGSGRWQLIQIQFLAVKAESTSEAAREDEPLNAGRFAAVLLYRYDTDQGIHVAVNLTKRSVGSITRLDGRAVPLAREEISRAFARALLNREVRTRLGPGANEFVIAPLSHPDGQPNRVEGLRVIASSARDLCYRHRCIELHFRNREGYLRSTSVIVDLSNQTVKLRRTAR